MSQQIECKTEKFHIIIKRYKLFIEDKIRDKTKKLGLKTTLRDACESSVLSGGKRFRPALVLMMGKALSKERDVSEAAMAIEFFHTASLIADDLPSMDDDDIRRNQPTLHKVYGE